MNRRVVTLLTLVAASLAMSTPIAEAKKPTNRARIHQLEKRVKAQDAVIADLVRRLDRMDAVEACTSSFPAKFTFDLAPMGSVTHVFAVTFVNQKLETPAVWIMTRDPECGPRRDLIPLP
jgi:hypothetical protein